MESVCDIPEVSLGYLEALKVRALCGANAVVHH